MSPWLLVGLGTGQVLGKLGAQVSLRLGPQEVQRLLGRRGWEAAAPKSNTSGAARAWAANGIGGGVVQDGPVQRSRPGLERPGVGGHRYLRTPHLSTQAPRARVSCQLLPSTKLIFPQHCSVPVMEGKRESY